MRQQFWMLGQIFVNYENSVEITKNNSREILIKPSSRKFIPSKSSVKPSSRKLIPAKYSKENSPKTIPVKISSLAVGRDKYIYTPFPRMNTWSAKYIKVEKIEISLMDINQKLYVRWEGTWNFQIRPHFRWPLKGFFSSWSLIL